MFLVDVGIKNGKETLGRKVEHEMPDLRSSRSERAVFNDSAY
jgi:hypothetical protein